MCQMEQVQLLATKFREQMSGSAFGGLHYADSLAVGGTVRSLPSLIDAGTSLREPNGAIIALDAVGASVLQVAVLARVGLFPRPTAEDIGHGYLAESSRSSHDNARAAAGAHNCSLRVEVVPPPPPPPTPPVPPPSIHERCRWTCILHLLFV